MHAITKLISLLLTNHNTVFKYSIQQVGNSQWNYVIKPCQIDWYTLFFSMWGKLNLHSIIIHSPVICISIILCTCNIHSAHANLMKIIMTIFRRCCH